MMCLGISCMSRVCRRVLLLWALFSVWLGACDAFLNPSSPWNIRRHSMLPKLIVQFSNSERAARRNSDGSSAWKVGDVYKDLDRLERAINFANAEQNLKQVERMELLQHFSSARRPLFPDMRKFIITPLGLGLVMRFVRLNSTTSFVSRICTMGLDFHFWTFVVAAPIFLLAAKKISKAPPEPMPEEIRDLDPEYLSFVTPFIDWESPEKSCRDYVMFLLEFWTSAVACMAVIGALQLLVKLPRHNSVRFWLAVTQLFTRIAALASLYQYPKQMFQLQRSKQPRPLGLFPTLMQTLVSCMFIAAPLGISSDLSKVLVFLQKDSLVALYSSVPAFIFGTWIRTQHTEPLLFRKLNPRSFGERLLYTAASLAFWKKPISNFCESLTRFPTQKIVHRFKMAPFRNTFATTMLLSVVMFPILTSIIHLVAIGKLFRVVYTHDLSLGMDVDKFKSCMENESDLQQRMQWRYRLEWRENKRLNQLVKEWDDGFGYWLLSEGTVREKLAKELREKQKSEAMKGVTLLDRMQKVLDSTPTGTPMRNRDDWKPDAMKRIAEKHQEDYDKSDYQDPLGVAVQQTLGIGLGFNFDHNRILEPDEEPTIRRLQARAAKSAIKRVQQLYDTASAANELDGITDSKEREKKVLEMRKRTKDEVEYLARRLTELVPVGFSEEFEETTRVQQFRQKSNYVKTSSHEYFMKDPPIAEPPTTSLKDIGSSTLDAETAEITKLDATSSPGEDDEFVETFVKRMKNVVEDGSDDDDDDDDDDDKIEMMLA